MEYILPALVAFLVFVVVAWAAERVRVRDCCRSPKLRRDLRRRPVEGKRVVGTSAE